MILLQPTYFSPIIQYVAIAQSKKVIFEIEDNFQKQTYRNRCYIYTANGKHLLNVPIQHTKGIKQKTKERLASQGYPNAEIDISSEATYVESGSMKLAVIRFFLSSDGSSAVFVHGIIGNELKRIGCVKISNERIPISYGTCADKIKEVFGIKISS